jgi:hypothetical protein
MSVRPLKSVSEVEMPANVALLPKDSRGYPIPYTVAYVEGKPDFTVVDPKKWARALKFGYCGVCGKPNYGRKWFIGGPACHVNRLFFDHPMHEECARYAMVVCPYLAIPKMGHRKEIPEGMVEVSAASSEKPDRFMLARAKSVSSVRYGDDVLLKASPWEHVEWWVGGEQV